MMRSLYSAVSGLKTHQTRMDVIGNNIANVNTEAFKASSVTFSEIMYQTTSGATGGNGATGVGGVNAKQIGLGVVTGSTTVNITAAGAAETTGNPFDLKLTDSQTTNFFIVSDGTNTLFTRAGSYYVDGNGYLCMSSTGYTLMGWQVDPETGNIRKDTVTPLQVMAAGNQTSDPEATEQAYLNGVLDKNDTNVKAKGGYGMSLTFFDDLGYSYSAKFSITPDNVDRGEYKIALSDIVGSDNKSIFSNPLYAGVELKDLFGNEAITDLYKDGGTNNYSIPSQTTAGTLGAGKMYYNPDDSKYYVVTTAADDTAVPPVAAVVAEATLTDWTDGGNGSGYFSYTDASGQSKTISVAAAFGGFPQTEGTNATITIDPAVNGGAPTITGTVTTVDYSLKFNTDDGKFESVVADGMSAATLNLSALGNNFRNINMDFSRTLNFNNGGTSTLKMVKGDLQGDGAGKKLGALTGISVDGDGTVYGSYDNGNTVKLCQIAVAQFANASGLEKVGESCYQTTLNSGDFDGIGVEIKADGSKISTGELEMSNVDLSGQFTDMIVTQRGFQANSRVITTSDTLLEELINLKR